MLADNAIFIARPSSPPWRRMGEGPLLFGLFALFRALPFAIFSFALFFFKHFRFSSKGNWLARQRQRFSGCLI